MNILIVDDNPTNLKLLSAVLDAEGHQVISARDGVEALETLERRPPDAVISDILMPRMDGYRLCFEVRRREQLETLPFIVYTSTYTSPSDEKTALDLGADIFLRKPAPAEEILAALKQAKKNVRQRARRKDGRLQEADQLKEYSEALVAKLEKRNDDLERQAEALRRNEAELNSSWTQLRALAERLQVAREEERIRIARELHDGLGEMLMGISMGISWMRMKLEKNNPNEQRKPLIDKTNELEKLVRDTANRVRQLCTELRPSILDDFGLGAAIEWQARQFQERTSIACTVQVEGDITGPPGDGVAAVFRIFQEILTNVGRHAKASRVQARIRQTESLFQMDVQDNGIGIPTGKLAEGRSLGLLGMRERAGCLGGSIEIHGEPGKGTHVSLTIPIAATQTRPDNTL